MSIPELLQELARQVRERTRALLQAAPEQALLWAPPGTQNHILWHAGHAVWLMDVLGLELLTGRKHLPAEWEQTFGMNCRPPSQTRQWPDRATVDRLLAEQLTQYLQVVAQTPEARLRLPVDPHQARHSLAGRLLHGLHDEACHSGEMYLLLKQWRQRRQA
jgi:AcrR family transcriptional regulator